MIAYVEQEIEYGTGFAIIVGLMVLSLVMLRCTSSRYTKIPPTGSVVGTTARILCSAARGGGWKRACTRGAHWLDQRPQTFQTFLSVPNFSNIFELLWGA